MVEPAETATKHSAPAKVWAFVNSPFGLWFLSTVVIGAATYWVPQWWHHFQQTEENELELTRVSREILCRLNTSLSSIAEAEAAPSLSTATVNTTQTDLVMDLLSANGIPAQVCSLRDATGRPQTLHSLLTEWQRLAPLGWDASLLKWKLNSYTVDERNILTLLSPKEDITQLTAEMRGVHAKCAGDGQRKSSSEANALAIQECRLDGTKAAIQNLLDRVSRPMIDIIVERMDEKDQMFFGLSQLSYEIDKSSKKIQELDKEKPTK
jgi:hypothetical protein